MCVSVVQNSVDEEPEEMPPPDAETVQVIPGSELIWKITPRPENSAKVWLVNEAAIMGGILLPGLETLVCSVSNSSMHSPPLLCN